MFCKHKFGKVEGGYQYCEKCGKASAVKCNHKWIEVKNYTAGPAMSSMVNRVIYILRCENCGEMKTFEMK